MCVFDIGLYMFYIVSILLFYSKAVPSISIPLSDNFGWFIRYFRVVGRSFREVFVAEFKTLCSVVRLIG